MKKNFKIFSIQAPNRVYILTLISFGFLINFPIWLLGKTYYLRDFWTNYYPSKMLLREHFLEGKLLLWNPWIGGGLPTIPDPNYGIFYFIYWPFLLFKNQAWALSLAIDFHLIIAALGTYYLGIIFLSRPASFIVSLSFAFSGLFLSNRINVQYAFAYAWIPFWYWALVNLFKKYSDKKQILKYLAYVGFFWTLQLLASDPQIVYLEGVSIPFLYWCFNSRYHWNTKQNLQFIFLFLFCAILVFLSALPQVWAYFEALSQTTRLEMNAEDTMWWSTHPLRFWELVFPMPWGDLIPKSTFWGKSLISGPKNNFYFYSIYMGALTLPLIILSFKETKKYISLWILGLIFLLISFGSLTPLYKLFYNYFPLWNIFRYPERILTLPLFGLCLLIGKGFDQCLLIKDRRVFLFAIPLIFLFLAVVFTNLLGHGGASHQKEIIKGIIHPTIIILIAFIILWRIPYNKRAFFLSFLFCMDLYFFSFKLQAVWDPPQNVKSPYSTDGRVLMPMDEILFGFSSFPNSPKKYREIENQLGRPNLNILEKQKFTNGISSLELKRLINLKNNLGWEEMAYLLNTKILIARKDLKLKQFKPKKVLINKLMVYENKSLPNAILCTNKWKSVHGLNESVREIQKGILTIETLDKNHSFSSLENNILCTLSVPSSNQRMVNFPPQLQGIAVQLSENYYPGWKFRVVENQKVGKWQEVLPANYSFIGALVPPGKTGVEFKYFPSWLFPCLFIAGLGIGIMVLIGIFSTKKL